jgi:hypothetical protein
MRRAAGLHASSSRPLPQASASRSLLYREGGRAFLLTLALLTCSFLVALPAQAAITLTVNRAVSGSATTVLNHDTAAQTPNRYISLGASLKESPPRGMVLTLQSKPLSVVTTTVFDVKTASDIVASGSYPLDLVVSVSALTPAGTYHLTLEITTIDKRTTVSVSGITAASRPYDGTTDISPTGTPSLKGRAAGDDLVLNSPSFVLDGKDAGSHAVEVTGSLGGADAFKYQLAPRVVDTTGAPLSVMVTPRPLSFTGSLTLARIYDGTTAASLAAITVTDPSSFSGLVAGEGFTLSTSGITAVSPFPSPDAGSYALSYTGAPTLTAPLGAALASNYTLSTPVLTGTITDLAIKLQVTTTEASQTVELNKFFSNDCLVSWGDGTPTETKEPGITVYTYATPGSYTIRLSPTGPPSEYALWTFDPANYLPFVRATGTTASSVIISSMPPMHYFLSDATTAPDYFFAYFNYGGAIASLPAGSFDTSQITTAGDRFFSQFAEYSALTSLPAGSFNTSRITTAGERFFSSFVSTAKITSLPEGSFDTSALTTAGEDFFRTFNYIGKLTSLPAGSFNLSSLTTAPNDFFYYFNSNGALTSLPEGSFDTSHITTAGDFFFFGFNYEGSLTSLPAGSFITSQLTKVGSYCFNVFNSSGRLASLPAGSFDTSHITTAGDKFFGSFNNDGALTYLPASFLWPSLVFSDTSESFANAFNSSSVTLAGPTTAQSIINGCPTPSYPSNCFSSNQPGYASLDANWKA